MITREAPKRCGMARNPIAVTATICRTLASTSVHLLSFNQGVDYVELLNAQSG
jgi:hypothetical protein